MDTKTRTEYYIKNVKNAFEKYINQEEDTTSITDTVNNVLITGEFKFEPIDTNMYKVVCTIKDEVVNGIYYIK
jgi:hypothetical protein